MRLDEITDASECLLTGCEADSVTDRRVVGRCPAHQASQCPAHRLSNDDRHRLDREGIASTTSRIDAAAHPTTPRLTPLSCVTPSDKLTHSASLSRRVSTAVSQAPHLGVIPISEPYHPWMNALVAELQEVSRDWPHHRSGGALRAVQACCG
jgi:hypothetical protein